MSDKRYATEGLINFLDHAFDLANTCSLSPLRNNARDLERQAIISHLRLADELCEAIKKWRANPMMGMAEVARAITDYEGR